MPSENWDRDFDDEPAVRGDLHQPSEPSGAGIVLTHGAGGDRHSALLVALADAFAERGVTAVRVDLPYRQRRPKGPPSPSGAGRDRAGLARAVTALREMTSGRVYLGGSSYGGRQASMLAADRTELVDGLLLLSYPLHPPGKADRMRTEHFPKVAVPVLFAHGSKDSFGTIEELEAAAGTIAAPHEVLSFDGAPHGLVRGASKAERIARKTTEKFLDFVGNPATKANG